jgi:hypothetical protein
VTVSHRIRYAKPWIMPTSWIAGTVGGTLGHRVRALSTSVRAPASRRGACSCAVRRGSQCVRASGRSVPRPFPHCGSSCPAAAHLAAASVDRVTGARHPVRAAEQRALAAGRADSWAGSRFFRPTTWSARRNIVPSRLSCLPSRPGSRISSQPPCFRRQRTRSARRDTELLCQSPGSRCRLRVFRGRAHCFRGTLR